MTRPYVHKVRSGGALHVAEPMAVRFARMFAVDPSGCWLWTAAKFKSGYGTIRDENRKGLTASRASWLIHRGEIPAGMYVCHRCDVRSCVNPDHLFLATNNENMQDMVAKGRQAQGERSGRHKLTAEHVTQARADHSAGQSGSALARKLGVSTSVMSRILRGLAWRSLLPEAK